MSTQSTTSPIISMQKPTLALVHSGLRRQEYAIDHFVGNFSFDSPTCALLDSASRLQLVALSGDVVAILHGFTEYRFGFVRFASVRAPESPSERNALVSQCDWHERGVALPFTHNNFLHALYHAVPSFEEALAGSASSHGGQPWPPPAFLPLFAHSTGADGRKTSVRAVHTWHAWELSVRALTDASASTIHAALTRLLTAPCTCFRRLSGSTAPFAPASPMSVSRLRRWASAVLLNVGRHVGSFLPGGLDGGSSDANRSAGVGSGTCCRILFIRRRHTRVLINEAHLLAALQPTDHVSPIHLEGQPLSTQLQLVSAASGLVGVHGQALALIPFLGVARAHRAPHESLRATSGGGLDSACYKPSLVEILPAPAARAAKMPFFHLYESLSVALGIEYTQLSASFARPCSLSRLRGHRVEAYLACNLTLAPIRFMRAIRRMRCHSVPASPGVSFSAK